MAVHAESSIQLNTIPAYTSLLGGHFVYRANGTTSTPASANVIHGLGSSFNSSNPLTWGYNTHIAADGIKLRYNETTLSEWINNCLTFYKPGTTNPSLQITGGDNAALNIYNPESNVKTLGLDANGLSFYGTSVSAPDVTLNADGLTLINGSIRGGVVGQDEFLYLSPQVFADEYEEYILSEDTEVDETKTYYIRSGEEGAYTYTEVSESTGSPQENEYYEIAHAPGTIPIDNYVKSNWRQIIGRNFAVDTDGNLYASNANINGAVTATSLTISDGDSTYSGISAINASGYIIEIVNDANARPSGTTLLDNQTYLYPIMRRNGEVVNYLLTSDTTPELGKSYYIRTYDSSTQTYTYTLVSNIPSSSNPKELLYYEAIDKTQYIWTYISNPPTNSTGDSHLGGIVATYNRTYRVSYALSDDEVGQATSSQIIEVDPQKYITAIGDTGIRIHPYNSTQEQPVTSNYAIINSEGMEIVKDNTSVAQFGETIVLKSQGSSSWNDSTMTINGSSVNITKSLASNPLISNASIATFGENTRIGLENEGHLLITPQNLQFKHNSNIFGKIVYDTAEGLQKEDTFTFSIIKNSSLQKMVSLNCDSHTLNNNIGSLKISYINLAGNTSIITASNIDLTTTYTYTFTEDEEYEENNQSMILSHTFEITITPSWSNSGTSDLTDDIDLNVLIESDTDDASVELTVNYWPGVEPPTFSYGENNIINRKFGFAIGNNLNVDNASQLVIGRFNIPVDNALFIIGNGDSNNERSNLLTVSDSNICIGKGVNTNYNNQFICGRYNEDKENILFAVGNGYNEDNRHNILSVYDVLETDTNQITDSFIMSLPASSMSYQYLSHHPLSIIQVLVNNVDKTQYFYTASYNDTVLLHNSTAVPLSIGDVIEVTYTVTQRHQMMNINDNTYIGSLPGNSGTFVTSAADLSLVDSWTFTIPNDIYPYSTFYVLWHSGAGGMPTYSVEVTHGTATTLSLGGFDVAYNGANTLTCVGDPGSGSKARFKGVEYSTTRVADAQTGVWLSFNSAQDPELYGSVQALGWMNDITEEID